MNELLNKLKANNIHLYPAEVNEIQIAEKKLEIEFSDEYVEFLKNIGAISFNGEEIFGLGIKESSYRNVINATDEVRNFENDFPKDIVALYSFGDGHQYYLYDNKSSQVLYWNSFKNKSFEQFNGNLSDFISYIIFS